VGLLGWIAWFNCLVIIFHWQPDFIPFQCTCIALGDEAGEGQGDDEDGGAHCE
jgi:hypothetical protein